MASPSQGRTVDHWAGVYDLVDNAIMLLFGGQAKLRRAIIGYARLASGARVLDIGAGTGTLLAYLSTVEPAPRGIIGIELSWRMLQVARRKFFDGSAPFLLNASCASLPLGDETFDCVFNVWLLHHVPGPLKVQALAEARRVLKPGGALITVDVDRPTTWLGRLIAFPRRHVPEIRDNLKQPLVELLRQAGFRQTELLQHAYGIFSFLRSVK